MPKQKNVVPFAKKAKNNAVDFMPEFELGEPYLSPVEVRMDLVREMQQNFIAIAHRLFDVDKDKLDDLHALGSKVRQASFVLTTILNDFMFACPICRQLPEVDKDCKLCKGVGQLKADGIDAIFKVKTNASDRPSNPGETQSPAE